MKKQIRSAVVATAVVVGGAAVALKKLSADPELKEAAKNNGKRAWNDTKEFGKSVKDVAKNVSGNISKEASNIKDKVKTNVDDLKGKVKAEVDDIKDEVKEKINEKQETENKGCEGCNCNNTCENKEDTQEKDLKAEMSDKFWQTATALHDLIFKDRD